MSKTIVNIIDQSNPLPAFLFTKEQYEPGDSLLFITTREEMNCISLIVGQLGIGDVNVKKIVIDRYQNNFLYEHICRTIKGKLCNDTVYHLNLAGGNRYMTLSVQHVFEEFNTLFYYKKKVCLY